MINNISSNILKIVTISFIIIYTITPSYTKLFGNPVYRLAVICFFVFSFYYIIRKKININIFIYFSVVSFLQLITFAINLEYDRIITEILAVWLPLMLLYLMIKDNYDLINTIISCILFSCFIICCFGVVEEIWQFNIFSLIENYHFENNHIGSVSSFRWGMYRIEQSFNTALTYALYLQLCAGICIYKCISTNECKYKLLLLLISVNLFFTVSRGISVCYCLQLITTYLILWNRTIDLRRMGKFVLVFIVFFIFVSINPFDIFGSVSRTLESAFGVIFGINSNFTDDSMTLRNGFQSVFLKDFSSSIYSIVFGFGEIGSRKFDTLDNNWMYILSKSGVVGLLSFCMLNYIVVKKMFIVLRNSNRDDSEFQFVVSLGVAVLFYLLSLYTVAQMEDVRIYVVCLAILIAFPCQLKSN